MRQAVFSLLREAQQQMSGHAIYMNYQFIHFSVVAEPAALLAVEVEIDGNSLHLEEVAEAGIQEKNQFAIIPKDQDYLFSICKAIGVVHPDYKIELKPMDEEDSDSEAGGGDQDADDGPDRYILCTMPKVDKDRRDAGMDYVKTIYDETISKIDAVNTAYGGKIAKKLVEAQAKELDEAKEELQKLHEQHNDLCKSYREEKEAQIEEAYQLYLKAQAEQQSAAQEKQAAHGEDAGKQFNMGAFAEGKE